MREYLRVARLYIVVLAIFTIGRLAVGFSRVPYERGHHLFSLVIMTLMASCFYGAFCRRWRGYTVTQALGVGATLALLAQAVILVMTVLSYALHLDTYFSNPHAVMGPGAEGPVGFVVAVGSRLGGAVVNVAMNALSAAVGWAMGNALPEGGRAS